MGYENVVDFFDSSGAKKRGNNRSAAIPSLWGTSACINEKDLGSGKFDYRGVPVSDTEVGNPQIIAMPLLSVPVSRVTGNNDKRECNQEKEMAFPPDHQKQANQQVKGCQFGQARPAPFQKNSSLNQWKKADPSKG
jgi:hypothetical protein